MSHEAARQQLPAAARGGLQPSASFQRPPRRPRRPGACPRPGPRAALPPASRLSPAAFTRHLVPAPRLGGCCTQRWVWPRCPCIALLAGPCRGKRRARGSVRSGQVPGSAFPRLSAYRSTSLIPKPPFISVHFLKSLSVAFTKTPTNYCRFHWKVFSGCGVPLCKLAEGNPVDGKCREEASCFLGGGA